jgi:hypothetical protein
MYSAVLLLHSWLRWVVILAGLIAIIRAFAGWRGRGRWTAADDRAGFLFTLTLDIQVLVGALLYFWLSPITSRALQDFGTAMRTSSLRYWAVEHVFGIVVALALAHIGRARIRKTADAVRRHRLAAILFGLALIALLISIPWPGMPNARPLLRW